MASGRPRRNAAAACGVIGILLILTALLLGTPRGPSSTRGRSRPASPRASRTRVAEYVSEQIADAVIKSKPDLIGLRPVLVGAARGIVSTLPASGRGSSGGARGTPDRFFRGGEGDRARRAGRGRPHGQHGGDESQVGEQDPPRLAATIGRLSSLPGGERAARLARFANRMRAGSLALLLVGVLSARRGVALECQARSDHADGNGARGAGRAARVHGPLWRRRARAAAVETSGLPPALTGLASAFLGGLMLWAIGLALGGLVLAAASASLLERVPLHHLFDASRHWLAGPQENMRWRLARGIVGGAIGGAFLLWPLPSLTVVAWLCGVLIAFAGLREVFIAVLHLLPPIERTAHTTSDGRSAAPRWAAVALVGASPSHCSRPRRGGSFVRSQARRSPRSSRRATGRRRCATADSIRSCSRRRTTRWAAPIFPAGCSPVRTRASRSS